MTFRLFGGFKLDAKARAVSLKHIGEQSVLTWSENDVAVWLEEGGFKSLSKVFVKNSIAGEQLVQLTDQDLINMKINKVGERKKLLNSISRLIEGKKEGGGGEDESSLHESSISSSSRGGADAVAFKVLPLDGAPTAVGLRPGAPVSFSKIMRKLERKLGYVPVVAVKEGDKMLLIEDQSDWMALWDRFTHSHAETATFEFHVRRAGPNELSKAERSLLESLVDAAVVADANMTILHVNKIFLELTGYESKEEVLGRNVATLMPDEIAKVHASYVESYLRTGSAKVIGKGRAVLMKRRDGSTLPVWLSLTEQKKTNGRHTFLATLHAMNARVRDDASLRYAVLDAIQKVAIVIDQKGIIKFMNRHAEGLLGWDESALGLNVSMLMPNPYSGRHDTFLANYLSSGVKKIIGRGGRIVVAQRKDGSNLAVEIAVDEVSIGRERHFVGIISELAKETEMATRRSILQDTRGVINSLAMPAVIMDRHSCIQGFNQHAEGLLGYKMVNVLGEHVGMLMPAEIAARHDTFVDSFLKTGVAKVIGSTRKVIAKRVDGTLTPVQLSLSQTVNPDDPQDVLFTALMVPAVAQPSDDVKKDEAKAALESVAFGAAEHNVKQMSSEGDSTVNALSGLDFGAAEEPNFKHRRHMEDAWIAVDDFGPHKDAIFWGLYDGHGGASAASYTSQHLHQFLDKEMREGGDSEMDVHFEKAYRHVHEAMGSEIGKSGTTAVAIVKRGSSLFVSNVGDSRAVIVRGKQGVRLTKDHKPDEPEEKKLVESKGGVVIGGRVSGILAVSRSLGDYKAEKYVSRSPTVSTHSISADDVALVIACDGLFDVCSDQDVADLVHAHLSKGSLKIAKTLVKTAIDRGTTDNVSVMVSVFRK